MSLAAIAGNRLFSSGMSAEERDQPGKAPKKSHTLNAARESLRRAAAFLWSKQSSDGGWHSETYGLLKSGQALTPFVLHALLDSSQDKMLAPRPAGAVERSLEFIQTRINSAGALGCNDPDVLEYPNYSTSYALRCFVRVDRSRDRDLVGKMRSYLVSEQFGPGRGFREDSPAYGGWGFGGEHPPGETGHIDLAHTRHVLQALRLAGEVDPHVFERACHFLRYVQRHPDDRRPQPEHTGRRTVPRTPYDGGFYFSPIVLNANKGRLALSDVDGQEYFRSYATATCDGLLALKAAGVADNDERFTSAVAWLRLHPRVDLAEGIPMDQPERWDDALFFYHLATRSEVYRVMGWPGDWRLAMAELLCDAQRVDGSFVNQRSHLMKEDDPLLCTAMALMTLGNIVQVHFPRTDTPIR